LADNIIILNDNLPFLYVMTEDSFSIKDAAKEKKNNKSNGKYISKSLTGRLPKKILKRKCLLHLRKLSNYAY